MGSDVDCGSLSETDWTLLHFFGIWLLIKSLHPARTLSTTASRSMSVCASATETHVPDRSTTVADFNAAEICPGSDSGRVQLSEMGCFFFVKKVDPSALPSMGRMRSSAKKRSYESRSSRRAWKRAYDVRSLASEMTFSTCVLSPAAPAPAERTGSARRARLAARVPSRATCASLEPGATPSVTKARIHGLSASLTKRHAEASP
mmetsp:Transcript_1208/g.3749  ORF Transcript_1208/g.3749 Transcript_1208/m.3749 type:complete len:204 (+) Transcript_1208:244-855(+)